jgi:hypothetical protein
VLQEITPSCIAKSLPLVGAVPPPRRVLHVTMIARRILIGRRQMPQGGCKRTASDCRRQRSHRHSCSERVQLERPCPRHPSLVLDKTRRAPSYDPLSAVGPQCSTWRCPASRKSVTCPASSPKRMLRMHKWRYSAPVAVARPTRPRASETRQWRPGLPSPEHAAPLRLPAMPLDPAPAPPAGALPATARAPPSMPCCGGCPCISCAGLLTGCIKLDADGDLPDKTSPCDRCCFSC